MTTLENKRCLPCEGIGGAFNEQKIQNALKQISKDWQTSSDQKQIFRDFRFKNYYQTMAFVNAIAWMAHQENHHPDLEIGYNHCLVRYSTHALGGLSENDFICAAKVDALFKPYEEKTHERK